MLRRRTIQVALGLIVLLVAARAVLPIFVKDFVNKKLDELDGYSGLIRDVDLHLWRGAYSIEGIQIVKTGGKVPAPFFSASEVDLSIEWKALLDGALVAEIDLYDPKINFVAGPTKAQTQAAPSRNWQEVVMDLVPFKINRFAVHRGQVHFRDFNSAPKVDIYVQNIDATVRNLTNSEDLGRTLYATIDVRALAMKSGRIRSTGRLNPYKAKPEFDIDFKLEQLDLRQINDYFRAYANVDVERGKFSLDAEIVAEKGRLEGYAKPFIEDLDVLRWQEENESLANKLWQGAVEIASELFQNQPRDRIATKIPIRGSIDDPNANIWATIGGVLKNAFIQGLGRGVEGSIGEKSSLMPARRNR